ncbi:hypothetical protein QVD17_20523 [Tagetes erecta]|uniref:F-box domain-containing protein n=1 Tax=Tagetes erecta TaxID=13708 RepID=A0AAD8NXZ4_TARER|nr:hypothetical protein QVD17_20523 [Tagetes erecta]
MSDNLPIEIQMEIMLRLPVKSLIKFRSVSKACKSMIDSSDFAALYSTHHTQQQHLLVTYEEPPDYKTHFISISDDHTFPQKVYPTVPLLLQMLTHSSVIASDYGLVCMHGTYSTTCGGSFSKTDIVVIWNISIRRAIPIVVPKMEDRMYGTSVGFGVCRATKDPKIVKITYVRNTDMEKVSCIPSQVEVFTVSAGAWRRPYKNLPGKSIKFLWLWEQEAVDGFLYWRAIDMKTRTCMDDGYKSYNLIISFDLTTEEFREVNLPRSLEHVSIYDYSMSKLKESLVVLHRGVEANTSMIDVWMMEDGVSKLFTKLYTINVNIPNAIINLNAIRNLPGARVQGFRKSGEPIIEVLEDNHPSYGLFMLQLMIFRKPLNI